MKGVAPGAAEVVFEALKETEKPKNDEAVDVVEVEKTDWFICKKNCKIPKFFPILVSVLSYLNAKRFEYKKNQKTQEFM